MNLETLRLGLARMIVGKSFTNPSLYELGIGETGRDRIPEARPGNYDKYLKTYADELWVHNCVSILAQDMADAPIYLRDKGSKKRIEKHDVLTLLNRPNTAMSLAVLKEFISASEDLAGNAYLLFDDIDGRGQPHSLWPMMPDRVTIVPSKDPAVFIEHYAYEVNGKQILFERSEVAQFKRFNPLSMFYGLPALSAARMSADTDRASSKYNLKFFDNSARPDIVFSTPHSLTPDQRKRMKDSWFQRHGGEGNAHGASFLEKGTTVEVIGVNQQEMAFIEQKKMSREEILAAYRIPPAIVGLFNDGSLGNANTADQERIYQRRTIIPRAERFCSVLNDRLLPLFDKAGALEFFVDKSQISAIQEDESKRAVYAKAYFDQGVPLNALIDAYGLPFKKIPVTGDVSFLPSTMIAATEATKPRPTPQLPGAPGAGEPDPDEEDPEKPKPPKAGSTVAPSAAQMAAKHVAFLAQAASEEGPFRAAVGKHFDEQRAQVVERIAAGGVHSANGAGLLRAQERTKLAAVIAPFLAKALRSGMSLETDFMERLAGRMFLSPTVKKVERINKWVEKNAFAWAGDITETTLEKLDAVLQQALEDGLGVDETAKLVAEAFDAERDYRTLRIAQTEIIASLNEGANEAYRENPFLAGKAWLSTDDEVTRESHLKAGIDYGVKNAIGVDDNFIVGTASGPTPGQTGDPSEDINCRCTMVPVLKKVGED